MSRKKAQKFPVCESVGQVYAVPIKLIEVACYNPPSRSNPQDTKIKGLAKSMQSKGQVVPAHVMRSQDGKGFIMEEGHRRLTACKILQWTHINAVITDYDPTSNNAAERWQVIADEVSKIDSAGRLHAYLANPLTASKKMREKFAKMERLVGLSFQRKLAAKGKGWAAYNRGIQVAKFIGLGETEYLRFSEYYLDVPEAETECRKLYEAEVFDANERRLAIATAFTKGIAPKLAACKVLASETEVNVRVRSAA